MNQVDYLRISLIDRCNFRCQYCMPVDAELEYLLQQDLLTFDELLTLLKEVFIPVGFSRFRLTGGEPLLRPDVVEIVRAIASFPETQDLSMTTNGFLLAGKARELYDAGLRRINISLDSLNPDTFNQIIGNSRFSSPGVPTQTGAREKHPESSFSRFPSLVAVGGEKTEISSNSRGGASQKSLKIRKQLWQSVWDGIQTAYQVGFNPLKLNVVVIPGVNDGEILDLAALTIDRCWHVRFIEFMPIGNDKLFGDTGWIPSEELRQQIRQRWGLTESSVRGSGPADVFQIPDAKGTLGFISQMSECFCDRCNRMRLSADGWLRPCLLNETGQINLKTALREGVPRAELREKVSYLLGIKPEINFKERDSGTTGTYGRTMSQIGG